MQKHTGINLSIIQSLTTDTFQKIAVFPITGGFPAEVFALIVHYWAKPSVLSQTLIFLLLLVCKLATTILFILSCLCYIFRPNIAAFEPGEFLQINNIRRF